MIFNYLLVCGFSAVLLFSRFLPYLLWLSSHFLKLNKYKNEAMFPPCLLSFHLFAVFQKCITSMVGPAQLPPGAGPHYQGLRVSLTYIVQ